jgi:hypothetical protein
MARWISVEAVASCVSEETERLSRAVEATFGEDVWTDADVEFTAERFGEDPDMPGVPFYAFGSLFPRVTRYAFVMLATMFWEGELRLCCSALAADRGLNKFQEQGRVAVLEQLRRYLERTAGLSVGGDLWRRSGEVLAAFEKTKRSCGFLPMFDRFGDIGGARRPDSWYGASVSGRRGLHT